MQYDLKNGRSFLRRSKVDSVHVCDLYLGSSINILGRQLTLVEYANEVTRKRLGFKTERCTVLCLICYKSVISTGWTVVSLMLSL